MQLRMPTYILIQKAEAPSSFPAGKARATKIKLTYVPAPFEKGRCDQPIAVALVN